MVWENLRDDAFEVNKSALVIFKDTINDLDLKKP